MQSHNDDQDAESGVEVAQIEAERNLQRLHEQQKPRARRNFLIAVLLTAVSCVALLLFGSWN